MGEPDWGVGAALPRFEDGRLITGRGRYVANQRRDRMLYCVFARSSEAHGRITGLGLEEARGLPGVVAAYGAADLGLADIPAGTEGRKGPEMSRPPLARERVRYSGEPVAAVVADSRYAAADAVEAVDLDVEPLTVVTDPGAALRGADLLFPEAGTNTVGRAAAPAGASSPRLQDWPVRITVETRNQRLAPVPVEPLTVLAEPTAAGLTFWCGHQAPHRLRGQLARLLGLGQDQVRVVVPDVGGAFGLKGMLYPEYLVVAAAALRLGRPVQWVETRSEQFLSAAHGRGMRHRVHLAGERSGRVRAAKVEILADVGAYPHNGADKPAFTSFMAQGPYDIPDTAVESTTVVTNLAPTGSYRGAGRPEATYAIERAMEQFGRATGLDGAAVRRMNLIGPEAMPYRTATGALYDSGDYAEALDTVLREVGAEQVREEQRRRREAGADPIGLGTSVFVERAGAAADSSEYARVELDAEGRLLARVGTAATGQGHETAWAQVLAGVFNADPRQVRIVAGDTGAVAAGTGSFASRSAQVGGSAVHRTAWRVRELCQRVAAELLQIPVDGIRMEGGAFTAGGRKATLAEVAADARAAGIELAAEEDYSPHAQTFPYGAVAAVTEVDLQTGKVRLSRIVAADDCGTVLNPMLVEGQVHGSAAQGVAQALYEGIDYDEGGQLRTATLMDYLAPTAPDLPAVESHRLTHPAPSNPLGAKGAGESGCIGVPPAIVLATLDALAPYGVTDLDMPLTPEQVWRALNAGGAPG